MHLPKSSLLPVCEYFLGRKSGGPARLIILQHALRDSVEFVRLAKEAGYEIDVFIAKPNSKEKEAIAALELQGVEVVQETYATIEGTDLLDRILQQEAAKAREAGESICIIDVGGYFCMPLQRAPKNVTDVIKGVVEVTTFGHNRYIRGAPTLALPVLSIARSPIKEVEAASVGETVIQATEDILREVGLTMASKTFGLIGYGMIGRRIAAALKARNLPVVVGDLSQSANLQAKLENLECVSIPELLSSCDIVFSATASQSVSIELIENAKTGIMLVSGGSKANEFDVEGIRLNSIGSAELSPNLEKFDLRWGRTCVLANEGKAVNFLKGGSPEEVMDPVFAEQAECVRHILSANVATGSVGELPASARDKIAEIWIGAQQNGAIDLFQ